MELAALDTFAAYIALAASGATSIWAGWSKFKDGTGEEIRSLREELANVRSFHDRLAGATLVQRVTELEQRQRDSETAMARVEQRLSSIDSLLTQIAANIQTLASMRDG